LSELLLRLFDLDYDLAQEDFRRYDTATSTWATISRVEVGRLVTGRLVQIAQDFPEKFPPSEIRKSKVSHLLWLMESRSTVALPTPEEALDQFFSQVVEPRDDAKLTTHELYEWCAKFCRMRKFPLCTPAYFARQAAKRFGPTAHCCGANGTERGRSGFGVKEDLIMNPALVPQNSGAASPVPTPGISSFTDDNDTPQD
jgi:hypothetical protein